MRHPRVVTPAGLAFQHGFETNVKAECYRPFTLDGKPAPRLPGVIDAATAPAFEAGAVLAQLHNDGPDGLPDAIKAFGVLHVPTQNYLAFTLLEHHARQLMDGVPDLELIEILCDGQLFERDTHDELSD